MRERVRDEPATADAVPAAAGGAAAAATDDGARAASGGPRASGGPGAGGAPPAATHDGAPAATHGAPRAAGDGRRVTIRDVARAAGVSTTTVSDALNGRGRLPAPTRERVAAVAERLGYRAHATARALRAGRSGQIALYCPLLAEVPGGLAGTGYYMELAMGAAEVALDAGRPLVLLPSQRSAPDLAAADVDGLIVADPVRDDPGVAALAARGVAIVTCERDPTPGAAHAGCVRSDHAGAVRELLDHLAAAGARRIALVAAADETAWSAEVAAAYAGWCAAHGVVARHERVPISPRPAYAEAATARLLDAAPPPAAARTPAAAAAPAAARTSAVPPPDAIVCAPDGSAAAVVRVAAARGLRVPGDLLVAACVDGPTAAAADPPVTAIDLRPALAGRRAAALLGALLAGRVAPGADELLPTRLVARASTSTRQGAP